MTYTSFAFYIMLTIALVIYYIFPKQYRWLVLLASNFCFIWLATKSLSKLALFLITIAASFIAGLILEKNKNKLTLAAGIIISGLPFFAYRGWDLVGGDSLLGRSPSWIITLGLAFYTMQIIAYLVDIYRGQILAQRNFLKYALFISFFPQILQGPIPRYSQLQDQLLEGHDFDDERLMRGIQLIIWGFFLKFMIADKAGIVVDTVFGNSEIYKGVYIWVAAILYSLQLYADFLACTTLSQGIASLFGISLADNFKRPYFSDSIKDFWRRWHISLSTWLKDYIYIPLGGNRKGVKRKYFNLIITFAVSGAWHGQGLKYVFWGLMHAFYQIIEDLWPALTKKLEGPARVVRVLINFLFVTLAWIIFRADGIKTGIKMIIRMFTSFNPWVFFDGSLFNLGLVQREWELLIASLLVLFFVSKKQEEGLVLRENFARYNFVFKWIIYIAAIVIIWVFGTYGYGYDAADFIYGGF